MTIRIRRQSVEFGLLVALVWLWRIIRFTIIIPIHAGRGTGCILTGVVGQVQLYRMIASRGETQSMDMMISIISVHWVAIMGQILLVLLLPKVCMILMCIKILFMVTQKVSVLIMTRVQVQAILPGLILRII